MRKRAISILLGTVLCGSLPCHATVTIGAASNVNFADATVGFGCSDLIVAGQASGDAATLSTITNLSIAAGGSLAPGASQMVLGGNFTDAGSFTPATSRVSFVDACGNGTSTVSGSTGFHDFAVTTATGKNLVLPAGVTQTVAHALTLQGAAGNLLQVTSSTSGQQALLNVSAAAAQSIAWVDARDNKASSAAIAPGTAATYNSVDSGDLTNWFADAVIGPGGSGTDAPTPAPALGRYAALLLTTLLAALACKRPHAS
jgi:hypothetical protein